MSQAEKKAKREIRRKANKERLSRKIEKRENDIKLRLRKRCASCGGYMTWCDVCEQWTQDCCEDFGSCWCS